MTSDAPAALRDRLIVALDVPDLARARALVTELGDAVTFYKLGLEIVYGGGLDLARELVGEGKKVFLDLKLHDIGTTVERATAQVARIGATFLTVHAYPQTLAAAVAGKGDSGLNILGVTVMTSYDDADLRAAGYADGVRETVERRALQARELGVEGLILSAAEVGTVRALVGSDLLLVTPGIRPAGGGADDQKRIVTPGDAVRAGSDHLVVGRPVTAAADPRRAAEAIIAEIAAAAS